MPGYDISLFINLEKALLDECMCGICHAIFKKPKVIQCCGQIHCESCILRWLSNSDKCPNDRTKITQANLLDPPKMVINILSKLDMKCEFHIYGCKEIITMENEQKHNDCCPYNPENVCKQCNIKIGNSIEHNCLENLKIAIKNMTDWKCKAEEQVRLSQTKLSELTLNFEVQSNANKLNVKEINNLKKKIEKLTTKNRDLLKLSSELDSENKSLKEFQEILYKNLQKIEKEKKILEMYDLDPKYCEDLIDRFVEMCAKRQDYLERSKSVNDNLTNLISHFETSNVSELCNNISSISRNIKAGSIKFKKDEPDQNGDISNHLAACLSGEDVLKASEKSFAFIRKFIGVAVSSVFYLRNAFPDFVFKNVTFNETLNVNMLSPNKSTEHSDALWAVERLFELFDIIELKYVDKFCISLEYRNLLQTAIIEVYTFCFEYKDNIKMTFSNANFELDSIESQDSQKFTGFICGLMRKLLTLCNSSDKIPENTDIKISLTVVYNSNAPKNYIVPGWSTVSAFPSFIELK